MDILELCDRIGVRCRPTKLNGNLTVVPLYSWYTYGFTVHESNPKVHIQDLIHLRDEIRSNSNNDVFGPQV